MSSKTFPSWDNTVAKRLNLTQTKAASELKLLILTISAAHSTMSSETEDTDLPTILPILRISSHQGTKQQRRDSKKEIKSKIIMYFCDQSQYLFIKTCTALPSETQNGKICYEDVLHLLTCPTCESYVSTPVIQCKRGQGELEEGIILCKG